MTNKEKSKLDGLSKEESIQLAYNKILRSASVCEQSTIKIRGKLQQAGYPDDVIESAIDKAIGLGIIDDTRYADTLIRSTLASHKGLAKVQLEIQRLGVDINRLEAYQSYCDTQQDEIVDQAFAFLSSHPPRSKNIYMSAVNKLLNRGYSNDIAIKAANRFMEERDQG